MDNLDYDNMLTKMNLKYLNGNLYKHTQNIQNIQNIQIAPKKTKEEYIQQIQQIQLERKYNQRQQIEKRKLIYGSKINITPNKLSHLRLS